MAEDLKISNAVEKAPLDLLPLRAMKGVARVFQAGALKYAPGNYLKAKLTDGAGHRYVGGFLRHLSDMQELSGIFSAVQLSAVDKETGLPEIDHAIAGMLMLRAILITEGVLAEDPGKGNPPPPAASAQLTLPGVP